MRKVYLFVFLLILSFTKAYAQCPTVHFGVVKNGCDYIFTDSTVYSSSVGQTYWFINGYPSCCQPYSDSAVLSGTFYNGDEICELFYKYSSATWCLNEQCYTVGCGGGCPNISQNFSATYTGNGIYTFKDSSRGEDTSAHYGWSINGQQITPSHGDSLVHYFPANQTVSVCDTIREPNCAATYVLCKNVTVIGCPFITQNWNYADTANNVVKFTDQTTGQDTSATYLWTFGDGTADSGKSVRHTYADTGYYYVVETVRRPNCGISQYFKTIFVFYEPPCINFQPSWTYALLGRDTVSFTDITPGMDSTSFHTWSYSFGSADTGSHVIHVFPDSIATYTVCETVRQYPYCTNGFAHYYCQTIRVSACPVVLQNFTHTYDSTNHKYTYTDSSRRQDVSAHYLWNFGDGDTSNAGSSVSHLYSYPGTYKVCEVIRDADCSPDTFCKYITYDPCTYSVHQNYTYTHSGGTYSFFDASTGTDFNATYSWTCTGMGSQTGSAINEIFTTPGIYTVCEIIHEPGCLPDTVCKSINYLNCPTITQNVNYTVNNALGSYTFVDASTGQDSNATYSWNYGDGHTGTGATANHTYAASGTYTLTETITEPGCTASVATGSVVVTVCPVISPSFTYTGNTDGAYTFTNTSTGQNGSATVGWSFGDGTPSGSGATPAHTYSTSGTYYVYMTITEPGCTSYNYGETLTVVACPNINLSFTAQNNGGGSYTFTDASAGANGAASYAWTFGDNNSGNGLSTSHTYAASGSYTVCETVTEPQCSAYAPYCQQIAINVDNVGINSIPANSISIYPNPASETLTIDMGNTDLSDGYVISIVNQLGQIYNTHSSQPQISSIHTSDLPNGMYIIYIKAGTSSYHYPISILH